MKTKTIVQVANERNESVRAGFQFDDDIQSFNPDCQPATTTSEMSDQGTLEATVAAADLGASHRGTQGG